jgi:hypothetical protein
MPRPQYLAIWLCFKRHLLSPSFRLWPREGHLFKPLCDKSDTPSRNGF